MNVSSYFNSLSDSCRNGCLGKRLQKYNFFLNPQAFSKKSLTFFFKPAPFGTVSQAWFFQLYYERLSFRLGRAKILSFPFIIQALFYFFLTFITIG